MNYGTISTLVALGAAGMGFAGSAVALLADEHLPACLYPPQDRLAASPGDTTYVVDPVKGDDGNPVGKPWKSMAKINALKLAPGDKVVIAPGVHTASLAPSGAGTAQKPVVIRFLPGVHAFGVENAIRLPLFVSNSCDDPAPPKPIGIMVRNARHMRLEGGGVDGPGKTTILYAGRMVEILNDHAEDITYTGLVFDLKRPTVSEFRVMDVGPTSAVLRIAEGSDYTIHDGTLSWTGDLGKGGLMVQEAIPGEGRCWRGGGRPFMKEDSLTAEKIEDLGNRTVRLSWTGTNHGLQKGHQFHFRLVARDSVGVHNARSKDIVFRDCEFNALTGMGFVSQFTENIVCQRVNVVPPHGSIRTCAAWGDIFQFSNCKGDILVDSCHLSGMQDDAINCHGTHVRIIGKIGGKKLLVRFMHPQTYGFAAFAPGDEVAVICHSTLREYADNPRRNVTAIEKKSDKDWLLTLDGPAPAFEDGDVLDNITWYPNITVRNVHVSMDPVRGFLLTTRGKVVIENNTFLRPAMPGILIEDDAEGWFESGPVRDMVIRSNRFIGCGIEINPQTHSDKPEEAVHENIRIENNIFEEGGGVSARSVKGLTVVNNSATGGTLPVTTTACAGVKLEHNDHEPRMKDNMTSLQVKGGRFLTLNTVVRVNQIEAARGVNEGMDDGPYHTPEAVAAFRDAVNKGFPGAKVTWAFSWQALHDERSNYTAIRKQVVGYHKEYGDEITFIPGGYFAPMYSSRAQVNRDIKEALQKIRDMVGNGYKPKSLVAGFLAAENMRYLAEEEGIHVCQGTIWSQYGIDNGDGDGSISYPYYPSREHGCKPAQGQADFIDFTRYDLPAHEPSDPTPDTPSRNWSLINRINQKHQRPEDAPVPLAALTHEEQELIRKKYPDLF